MLLASLQFVLQYISESDLGHFVLLQASPLTSSPLPFLGTPNVNVVAKLSVLEEDFVLVSSGHFGAEHRQDPRTARVHRQSNPGDPP